jgi:hypothetical protein
MKRILLALCAAALLLAPAALAVEPKTPSDFCKSLRTAQPALFGVGKTYRNLGACVSKQNVQAGANTANAAKTCKAEQADPNFATAHDGKTFAAFYGANGDKVKGNGNGNALGKCVSQHASQQTAEQQAAEVKNAKICKAELKLTPEQFAVKYPGKTFASKYGTNRNAKNAFGKCVSALAKAS